MAPSRYEAAACQKVLKAPGALQGQRVARGMAPARGTGAAATENDRPSDCGTDYAALRPRRRTSIPSRSYQTPSSCMTNEGRMVAVHAMC